MKIRNFLIIFTIFIVVFLIYIFNIDNKLFYLNFTDTATSTKMYNDYIIDTIKANGKFEYYSNYYKSDYRITDFINDINDNVLINNRNIQNLLIKSDILTLKIGNNELNYKILTSQMPDLFEYSDTLINDIEKLFIIIRKYCKEDIYFIGFDNKNGNEYNELYNYINLKVEDLCKEYNIYFIKSAQNEEIHKKIIKNLNI